MISHEHKCIFIHIRKNAGSSIINSFELPAAEGFDVGYGTDGTYDKNWDSNRYPDYLVFAVARNPWSRFISGWKWLARRAYDAKGNLGPEYYRRTSLKEVLRTLPSELPANSHDRRHLFWTHMDMLTDRDGRFVAHSILRFERLARDYKNLCKMINKTYAPLLHRNKGPTRPYWDYYDDETRELVGEIFREDIEYFGYKFGDLDSTSSGE